MLYHAHATHLNLLQPYSLSIFCMFTCPSRFFSVLLFNTTPQWYAQRGWAGPPTFGRHSGEVGTFVGHLGK